MTSENQAQKIHKKFYISFHTESSVRKRIIVQWKGPGKDVLFGWEHRILLEESTPPTITRRFRNERVNCTMQICTLISINFFKESKVKRIFSIFSLDFFELIWHFCRWGADVPPGKTSQAARSKEKRLYLQARGLSASVSFLSSLPLSRSSTRPISRAVFDSRKRLLRRLGYLSRNARPNKSGEDETRPTDIVRTCVTRQKRLRGSLSCPCSIDDFC